MGKKNTVTKEYMSVPEHFADSFNYYMYDGKQVIKPENLSPLDPNEIVVIPEGTSIQAVEKMRDILKQCVLMEDEQATYFVLGIENQADVHYAMPVRNMIYDALEYGRQVNEIAKEHQARKDLKGSAEFLSGFKKEDKIKPVITLTIYFGADEWDGPRSLKEMFGDVDSRIMCFVEDYKMHLIVPKEIDDFGKFGTEFGKVMRYISVSDDIEKCESLARDPYYGQVNDWTANFINTYLGFIFEEKAKEEEEEVEVCKALLDMKANAKAEGRAEGRAETVLDFLSDLGTVPEKLKKRIMSETDVECLKKWLKLAIKSKSIEEFVSKMAC